MGNLDLILYNGWIYTIDKRDSVYNWIKITNGKITELGKGELTDIPKDVLAIDLKGKTVFPGFYDNHVNLVQAGINSFAVNVGEVNTLDELYDIIREKAKTVFPGELIRFVGYLESRVKEGRFPTRQELDICAPNNPVMITGNAFHSSSVNSLMLHKLSLPYNLDGMGRDQSNTYTGYLTYKANVYARNQLFAQMDDSLRTAGVRKVIDLAIKNGITNIVTFEGGYISHENHAKYIFNHKTMYPIDIKIFYQTTNLHRAGQYCAKMLGGMFLDGTITSRNAAISTEYVDTLSSGTLFFTQADINEFVLQAHKSGYQLTAHCVGDRAVEQMINAYEHALTNHPRQDHRHRIEHCELMNDEMIQKIKSMELILSMQPSYEYYWGGEQGYYSKYMGELGRKTNCFNKIVSAGITVAAGSDYDITDINPWLGIHMAVNHPIKSSRVNVQDAIKMYTINGAYAVFEEDKKGSLELGKQGDCIIVDRDPYNISPEELKDITVLATVKEGNLLYRNGKL